LATDYIALDLETTGLDLENDSIIEIGAVRFDERGDVLETYETLVNPGRPLPPAVQDLTGISETDLADAPPLYLITSQLQAFLGDAHCRPQRVGFGSVYSRAEGYIARFV
jgi:DNA polymerase III epsilon subunit-like protein